MARSKKNRKSRDRDSAKASGDSVSTGTVNDDDKPDSKGDAAVETSARSPATDKADSSGNNVEKGENGKGGEEGKGPTPSASTASGRKPKAKSASRRKPKVKADDDKAEAKAKPDGKNDDQDSADKGADAKKVEKKDSADKDEDRAERPSDKKKSARKPKAKSSGKSARKPKVEAAKAEKPEKTEKKDDAKDEDKKAEEKAEKDEQKKPDEQKPAESKKADKEEKAEEPEPAAASDEKDEAKSEEEPTEKVKIAAAKKPTKGQGRAKDKPKPKEVPKEEPAEEKAKEETAVEKKDEETVEKKAVAKTSTGSKKKKKKTTTKKKRTTAKVDKPAAAEKDTDKKKADEDDEAVEKRPAAKKKAKKKKKSVGDSRAARPEVKVKRDRKPKPKRRPEDDDDIVVEVRTETAEPGKSSERKPARSGASSRRAATATSKSGRERAASTALKKVAAAKDEDLVEALHVDEKLHRDDPLVRISKGMARLVVERWQTLAFIAIVIVTVGTVIAVQAADAASQQAAAWQELTSAKSIADYKRLLGYYKGQDRECYPHIYLELLDTLETMPEEELDRQSQLEQLIEYGRQFVETYQEKPAFRARAALIKRRIDHEWKLELDFAMRRKADRDAAREVPNVPDDPTPAVVSPGGTVDTTVKGAPFTLSWPAIVIDTEEGPIVVELFDTVKPNAVANIMYLVREGFYDEDGPGGEIARRGGRTLEDILELGQFPSLPAETSFADAKENASDRLARIDDRWADRCEAKAPGANLAGYIGYSLDAERDALSLAECRERGIPRKNLKNTLALRLDDVDDPSSATTRLILNLEDNPGYDGHHIVIGRIVSDPNGNVDTATLRTISRISEEPITIENAYVLVARARTTPRELVIRQEIVPPDDDTDTDTGDGDGEGASDGDGDTEGNGDDDDDTEGTGTGDGDNDDEGTGDGSGEGDNDGDGDTPVEPVFEWVAVEPGDPNDLSAHVLLVAFDGDEPFALPPAEAEYATHLWVDQAVFEHIPAGQSYRTEAGEWTIADEDTYVRLAHNDDGTTLTPTRLLHDSDGDLIPDETRPMVRYPGYPVLRRLADKPPSALAPLLLPGERDRMPGPGPITPPPTGMPPDWPPEGFPPFGSDFGLPE